MKQVWPIVCALVIALSPGGGAHADGLLQVKASLSMDPRFRAGDRDHGDRGGDHGNRNDRDNGGQGNGGGRSDWSGNDGFGENRNDDRINQAVAMAIAARGGRKLDAGQLSGSVFWVRLSTAQGRVDVLVDVDTGDVRNR